VNLSCLKKTVFPFHNPLWPRLDRRLPRTQARVCSRLLPSFAHLNLFRNFPFPCRANIFWGAAPLFFRLSGNNSNGSPCPLLLPAEGPPPLIHPSSPPFFSAFLNEWSPLPSRCMIFLLGPSSAFPKGATERFPAYNLIVLAHVLVKLRTL